MAPSPSGENAGLVLPKSFHDVLRATDKVIVDRYAGIPFRRRSRKARIPALVFVREAVGDASAPEADPDLADLLTFYRQRLLRSAAGESGHIPSLVPHAIVDETRLPVPPEECATTGSAHVMLLRHVARQFRSTMPDGAGKLRRTEFDICISVLQADLPAEDADEEQRAIRDVLYGKYAWTFGWGSEAGAVGEAIAPKGWAAVAKVVGAPVAWLWRRWYGFRINRGRRMQWVGRLLGEPGRSFLNAAVVLRERSRDRVADGAATVPRDEAVVRQVLLTALLHDLAAASRPALLSPRRPRRSWPFVLLLPALGSEGSLSRKLLDTFVAVERDVPSCPVLVLAAATTDIPSYAAEVPQQGTRVRAQGIGAVFAAAAAGRQVEGAYLVPVSRHADDGAAADWVAVHRKVRSRPNRWRDWARPVVAALVATVVATTGAFVVTRPTTPDSCAPVATGEMVGLTDGADGCELATGLYASELKPLEEVLRRQNQEVDRHEPYRTLVFFAPLSVGSQSRRAVPTGIQMLRGALLAQKQVNSLRLKSQVPVRLLIANAGEYFTYGSHQGLNKTNPTSVDVAGMIVSRARRDNISAVIGLTQSRPESLQAAIELGESGIPVLGTGVSGQPMVEGDSPVSYFQISPPDAYIARGMASFALHSPRLRAVTKPSAGRSGPPAIVVFDPSDRYFSADLAHRFEAAYRGMGDTHEVPYTESTRGDQSPEVAANVCTLVRKTDGFVLFASRSGVMHDLFHYLQGDRECRTRKGRVAVLAESPAPDLILNRHLMAQKYSALTLFYNQFSGPDPAGAFAKSLKKAFDKTPDADAAAGYDAVNILFGAMDDIYDTDPEFTPSAVVTYLQKYGVRDYVGESGIISLGQGHKFPPNKEFHVREITPESVIRTDLTCGAVSVRMAPVTHWGPDGQFPCPSDD